MNGQVKIRGFRVELVEAVLTRFPGVREIAVADREAALAEDLQAQLAAEEQSPMEEGSGS